MTARTIFARVVLVMGLLGWGGVVLMVQILWERMRLPEQMLQMFARVTRQGSTARSDG